MNLVDSSAWLAYLAEEKNAAFFSEAIEDSDLLIVPTVCLYEVFKVVLREHGEEMALQIAATMQQGEIIDLTAELALEAAAVGHKEKLSFADSIIYTIAKQNDAVIWTQDEHFADKPDVQFKPKPRNKT